MWLSRSRKTHLRMNFATARQRVKREACHFLAIHPRSEYNTRRTKLQVNFSHTQLYEIHNNVFSQLLNLSNEYDFPCFCRKH